MGGGSAHAAPIRGGLSLGKISLSDAFPTIDRDEVPLFDGVFLLKKTLGSAGARLSTIDFVHQEVKVCETINKAGPHKALNQVAGRMGLGSCGPQQVGVFRLATTMHLKMEDRNTAKFGCCLTRFRDEKHKKADPEFQGGSLTLFQMVLGSMIESVENTLRQQMIPVHVNKHSTLLLDRLDSDYSGVRVEAHRRLTKELRDMLSDDHAGESQRGHEAYHSITSALENQVGKSPAFMTSLVG